MNPVKVAKYKALHQVLFWGSIGLFVVLALLSIFTGYAAPFAMLDIVWFMAGFRIIPTKERWVLKMFDDPYAVTESGLRWLPFLISTGDAFRTVPPQLDFPNEVLIITKPGKVDDIPYGTMTLRGKVSLMFRYPTDDNLLKTAKVLPSPNDQVALINYFQEAVFEEVRTIGGDFVYVDLLRRRGEFAEQVTEALTSKAGLIKTLLDEAGLVNPQVIIQNIDPPEGIMVALSAEEAARLQGRAARVTAEAAADGERTLGKGRGDSKRSEGEGVRDAQKMLYDMIREHPENIKIRALYTFSEMAQGPATTIFPINTNLGDVLRDVLGKPSSVGDLEGIWDKLPKNVQDEVMRHVAIGLKPGSATSGGKG